MNPYSDILELKKKEPTPAQTALRDAFLTLYKSKPYAEITVTELCAKAHVARTTFYAGYSNIDILLMEIEDSLIVDLLDMHKRSLCLEEGQLVGPNYTENMLAYIRNNYHTLHVLLVDRQDMRLITKWKRAIKYHFWDILSDDIGKGNKSLSLEVLASMAVGGYVWGLEHSEEFDIKRLMKVVNTGMNALLAENWNAEEPGEYISIHE